MNKGDIKINEASEHFAMVLYLLSPVLDNIERSEVLRMEFLFIPICSCQEHELIINSRCELSA
ncbi:hypothetical protein BpHYR1_023302 [Brachionus plicatilis]|uniref:Uncharacterized protein n=1 Tax=Brachionus plicatilis TaxID=10195 RepID=A0A3M7PRX9_BRAPC|nr:hypothetical protein BpHYR1_023302 [Brachionus plicatilis]